MKSEFPRIVTLLRKERGLSQKQAAMELGVSQALLSHYEKGIRECGLDFVIKIADYYNVSCDYLLGRTPDRAGATLKIDDIPLGDQPVKDEKSKSATVIEINKKLVINSLNILFDLLEQTESKSLGTEVSSYLMVSIYKMLRTVYSVNAKNPQAMFSVLPEIYDGLSDALQSITQSNAKLIASGKTISGTGNSDVKPVSIAPDMISSSYPELAPTLYSMIQKTEEKMKKLL